MDLSKSILAAVFTILGIIVGATLNDYFTTERETSRDLFSARLEAYNEFMAGQALLNKAQTAEDIEAANETIVRGKFRLAMLATEKTLASMINYWDASTQYETEKCPNPGLRKLDTTIYQNIRSELIEDETAYASLEVLVPFLWSCNL